MKAFTQFARTIREQIPLTSTFHQIDRSDAAIDEAIRRASLMVYTECDSSMAFDIESVERGLLERMK